MTSSTLPFSRLLRLLLLGALAVSPLGGCSGTRDCQNGECACPAGGSCDFVCSAPPCHVACEVGSSCTGTCGNATCTCEAGASCDFSCDSGPCHVACDGDNESCGGECQNGTCACGPGSECEFSCLDDNCKMLCDGACRVRCEDGKPCGIDRCALGEPVACPGGEWVVCGMDCPAEEMR